MRELKFRAWDMKMEKMITHVASLLTNLDGSIFSIKGYYEDDKNFTRLVNLIVKETVIEQYTGLKDKNGVEIYEGDLYITYGDKDDVYQVLFIHGAFCGGKSFDNCEPFIWDGDEPVLSFLSDVEIIGNIHQDPELLKEAL